MSDSTLTKLPTLTTALLHAAQEPLLLLGADEQVLAHNAAAAHYLHIDTPNGIPPTDRRPFTQRFVLPRDHTRVHTLLRDLSAGQHAATECHLLPDRHSLLRAYLAQEAPRISALSLHDLSAPQQRAYRLRGQFSSRVSHALRTPMTGVLGMLELLQETPLDSNQAAFTRDALDSAHSLLDFINALIDFSQLEAGVLHLNTKPFDLPALLHSAAQRARSRVGTRGLVVDLEAAPTLPTVVAGDAKRLRQALDHLLDNALTFTKRGVIALQARPQPTDTTDTARVQVHFAVIDTGIGIDEALLPQLFDGFAPQDADTFRTTGLGMGLPIVRQLITLMGGSLEVRSQPGNGSTFSFSLDLPPAPQLSPSDTPPTAPARTAPSSRVLLAEDDPLNASIVVQALGAVGIMVDIAVNGQDALDKLSAAADYGLLLLDINMPVLGGRETAARIRAMDAPLNTLPLIALTASTQQEDVATYRRLGMNAVIAKPFNLAELRDTVMYWLHVKAESSAGGG